MTDIKPLRKSDTSLPDSKPSRKKRTLFSPARRKAALSYVQFTVVGIVFGPPLMKLIWPLVAGLSSERLYITVMSISCFVGVVPVTALLTFFELCYMPSSLKKYLIFPDQKYSGVQHWQALKLFLIKWPLFGPVVYYCCYWIITEVQGRDIASETFPSMLIIARDVFASMIFYELVFYVGHRILHWPFFYRHFHYKHHKSSQVFGLLTFDDHPFEYIFTGYLPVLAGPMLMQSHVGLFGAWNATLFILTITNHSNLELPYLPSVLTHHYHHKAAGSNYGGMAVLDAVCDTGGGFEAWRARWEKERRLRLGITGSG